MNVLTFYFTAISSKADYEMLRKGVDELEKEVEFLEQKKVTLEESYNSTTDKLSVENSKLAQTVRMSKVVLVCAYSCTG